MASVSNISKLPSLLLVTRVSVVLFLLPWVLDKFTSPEHTAGVFKAFYFIEDLPEQGSYIIGVGWALLLLAFALGFKKRISYGLVMILHGVTVLTTVPRMIPYTEGFLILFMAAIPTLAAMITLYVLRDQDTIGTIGK